MKLKLSMLALGGLMAVTALTTTGCGDDVLGVNDTVGAGDVVAEADLASPTLTGLTVISETEAKISFSTSNAGDDAQGYNLLDATGAIKQTILAESMSIDTSFMVTIDKDVPATWSITAFEDAEQSTLVPVSFNARMMGSYDVSKLDVTASAGQGLQVDDSVVVASVASDIATTYEDGGMATFYFEGSAAEGITITPINLAHIVPILSTDMPQQADIDAIAGIIEKWDATTVAPLTVYSRGKSPRPAGAESGDVLEMAVDLEFLVVSANKSIARVVITAITGDVVSCNVYTPADNEGTLLYKTIK